MNDVVSTTIKSVNPNLRQRPSTAEPVASEASPGSDDELANVDWDNEFLLARQMIAARMKQQQIEDGVWPGEEEQERVESNDDQTTLGTSPGKTAAIEQVQADETMSSREEETERDLASLKREKSTSAIPPPKATTLPTAAPGQADDSNQPDPAKVDTNDEEKTCRICFEGEDPELGRLFTPCRCKGTARFVHTVCLDRWRMLSRGQKSSYRCDQCKYDYKLRRTKISGLATNKVALSSLTILLLSILLYLSGFVASAMIDIVEYRPSYAGAGGFFEDMFISDSAIIQESVSSAFEFFDQYILGQFDDGGTKGDDAEPDIRRDPEAWDRWDEATKRGRKSEPTHGQSWIRATLAHMMKGASLVGVLSGFQSIFSASLFGLRGTLFRLIRAPRRGRDQQQGGTSMIQIVLVSFVFFGVLKAATQVFRLVQWGAKKILSRVEGMVLDVN